MKLNAIISKGEISKRKETDYPYKRFNLIPIIFTENAGKGASWTQVTPDSQDGVNTVCKSTTSVSDGQLLKCL